MDGIWYCGMRVEVSDHITKQVQARRNRKKRINKKWLKRYGYKQVPDLGTAYVGDIPGMGKVLVCHPKLYEKIKRKIEAEQSVK